MEETSKVLFFQPSAEIDFNFCFGQRMHESVGVFVSSLKEIN